MKNYLKNKEREVAETHSVYVPQYRQAGLEPQVIKSGVVPAGSKPAVQPTVAPRSTKSPNQFDLLSTKQEYPNVLNPPTFATLDGNTEDIEDDFENVAVAPKQNYENANQEDIFQALFDLEDDAYLLMVNGSLVCSGPMEEIEQEMNSIVFGNHELCDGQCIDPASVMVLKKVKIKVGAFFS